MKRSDRVKLLMVALVVPATSALADDEPGHDPETTGAIVGRVVGLDGRPIAGADVWGVVHRDKVGSTRTDADGRFRLAALKPDRGVTVWADAPGVARERREDVHVFAGRDHDLGPLTLLPGTRITGRAVDARRRPVAGARIKVDDFRHVLGHTIENNQTAWDLVTDADGRFATPHLPAGEVHFRFAAPGKVRVSLERKSEPGTADVDLGEVTLADEVPLRGVVVDQDGKPAPGVEVVADFDYDNAAKTDEDGRFAVPGVGPRVDYLMLFSNNYFARNPIKLDADHPDLKLTVTKAYTIDGTAVDAETGKPVPIDTVRLCIVDRDPDGTYSLRG